MARQGGAAGHGRSTTIVVGAVLLVAATLVRGEPAQATWSAQASGAPAVTKVGSDRGPATGGSAVTLAGEGFEGATAVSFGGVPAPSFDVRSGSGGRVLNVIAPRHPPGAAAVTVTTPAGTSPAGPAGRFTYQPVRGHWTALPGRRRFSHTATLLGDGKVLVAGGCVEPDARGRCRKATSSAELFDPVGRSWSPLPDMTTPRISHEATLLPDGKVLVSGGCSTLSCLPECPTVNCPTQAASELTAEIYDPASRRWTPTGNMVYDQRHAVATLLPAGPPQVCGPNCSKVLVVGSATTPTGEIAPSDAELYDPRAGTWSATAPTVHTRDYPAAVVLRTGRVLVTSVASDQPVAAIPAEVFDPATATWAPTGNAELTPRIAETATMLPDGRVLAGALDTSEDGRSGVEIYDPTALPDPANPSVRGGAWKATSGPADGRASNTAVGLRDGKVLIIGGNRPPIATAELYDENTAKWSSAGTMAGARGPDPVDGAGPAIFTSTRLRDGTVLVVGASYQVDTLRATFNSHAASGFKVPDPASYGPSAELYTPAEDSKGVSRLLFGLVAAAALLAAAVLVVVLRRRRTRGERPAMIVTG